MAQASNPTAARRGAFFGRRKGHKLRPRRSELLATLLPQLALDLSRPAPAELRTLFAVPVAQIKVEVGFGGGEHLVREAVADPASGFIGCEPFVNGMASALALIEAASVRNIRLHHGDATDLLAWLPDRSVERIDLLYSDPWPKRRHWKRRFISDAAVRELARVTVAGGFFRFATDIAHYAEWTLLRLLRSGLYDWTAERANDWRKPWPGYAPTRYETKAVRDGRVPTYLVFRRR
jgi:tRNA (guanine-N7-)-methyltransferase